VGVNRRWCLLGGRQRTGGRIQASVVVQAARFARDLLDYARQANTRMQPTPRAGLRPGPLVKDWSARRRVRRRELSRIRESYGRAPGAADAQTLDGQREMERR
jgi:hypothetical protein